MMKLFLIGYRCTGKTTIGRILADRFNLNFMDTDRMIEQHTGSTILEIVETDGWKKFRKIEKKMLLNTLNRQNCVIATGGGIIIDSENRMFIKKNGTGIWLDADLKTILYRLNNDPRTLQSRPSLTPKNLVEETRELMKQRTPLYKLTAHMRIDTSFLSSEEIVNTIDRRLS